MGLVLAGGGSRRMGRDKALIELDGNSLIAAAAGKLDAVCREVLIADRGRRYLPDRPSVDDGPGRGPAAGILGAAALRPGCPLLVLACDLPAVPVEFLSWLTSLEPADWIVPRRLGQFEPLCALYGPGALTALDARVRSGAFDLQGLAEDRDLSVRRIGPEEMERFGLPDAILHNVNRPEDLERSGRGLREEEG